MKNHDEEDHDEDDGEYAGLLGDGILPQIHEEPGPQARVPDPLRQLPAGAGGIKGLTS